MTSAQEISQKVQDNTFEAVRNAQEATIEAVNAWAETSSKLTAQLPDFANLYEVPGFAEFTKQFPTVAEAIEANFDFAQRVLTNQRDFARRIVAAVTPAAE